VPDRAQELNPTGPTLGPTNPSPEPDIPESARNLNPTGPTVGPTNPDALEPAQGVNPTMGPTIGPMNPSLEPDVPENLNPNYPTAGPTNPSFAPMVMGGTSPFGDAGVQARPTTPAPMEVQPRDLQPRDVQGRDVQPRDVQPRDVQPRDAQPRDVQPKDVQRRDVQPRDVQPRDVQPRDVQPGDFQPKDVQRRDVQPRDFQPRDLQPEGVQPRDVHPRDVQPRDVQPSDAQPADLQPNVQSRDEEPGDVQPRDFRTKDTNETKSLGLDECTDVPTSWMTQACSAFYVTSSGMGAEICAASANDDGGCKRSCCEAGLYDVWDDDCSACELTFPESVPMPAPDETQCATDARICTDLRNGIQATAESLCVGVPEGSVKPCYPLNQDSTCNSDALKCTTENAGEIAHHLMMPLILGETRISSSRCSGGPEGPMVDGKAWGQLGGPHGSLVTEATCKLKCLGRVECRFALWRMDENNNNVGSCSSFSSCDSVMEESDKTFTVWEKT